jgi:hypothetical protein
MTAPQSPAAGHEIASRLIPRSVSATPGAGLAACHLPPTSLTKSTLVSGADGLYVPPAEQLPGLAQESAEMLPVWTEAGLRWSKPATALEVHVPPVSLATNGTWCR